MADRDGEVVLADADINHLVRVNGVEGVGLAVYKEAGANTVAVSASCARRSRRSRPIFPASVTEVTDEAALVEDAMAELQASALVGIALAIGVLFLFLRAAGPTVIVAPPSPYRCSRRCS